MTTKCNRSIYEANKNVEVFVVKLNVILQLNDPIRQGAIVDIRAEDLSIDSLNAIEIRSWILKELKVDIPILRILVGSTIRELLAYILEEIPVDLISLGAERRVLYTATQPLEHEQLPVSVVVNSPGIAPASLEEDFEENDNFLTSAYINEDEESLPSSEIEEKAASLPSSTLDAGSNSIRAADDSL